MARSRLAVALAGGVLALAAAHTGLWFWAVAVLEQQTALNLTAGMAPGWRAEAGPLTRGGWPMRAEVEVPALVLHQQATGLTWSAGRLTAGLAILRPRTLVLALDGSQSLRLGAAPPVPITAASMRAELPLTLGAPARALSVEVAEWRADLPGGALSVGRLTLQAQQYPAAPAGQPALTVALTLDRIGLPPGQPWPLGPEVTQLVVEAMATGPVPAMPDLQARAEAWRDGGGALELRRLDLHWGDVRLSASSTLALDAQLQPMGTATARVTGHGALLDALVAAGMLAPRGAVAARAVLGLMSRPSPDSGLPVVEVPLSLRDRTLSLGRIPLVRFPELVWRPPS